MAKSEVNAKELLAGAIPVGHWNFCGDEQHSAAVAALAKVIGKREANLPSWQRRLAVTTEGTQFLLVIDSCDQKDPSCINWSDIMPEALKGTPTALPIEAAVALLNSDQSPEKELQRRRALAAKRESEEKERARVANEKARAEAELVRRAQQERADFRANTWPKLSPLQQTLARLALAVADRDPKLAADIRAAADANDDFPRGPWWNGLDRTMESLRVADVFATIPEQTRVLLKIQHGNNPAKIVEAWEAMRATSSRAA